MGKSKNASFSYADKSKFQLLKDKLKEKKRVNQKLKSDIKEKHCEGKKKTKKSLWSRWLTSVRQGWSWGEARPPREESQILGTMSLEESVDLLQMAFDPEKKPSNVIAEPNQTELKTVTGEYSDSLCPEETFPGERSVLRRNDSRPMQPVKRDITKISRDPFKTHYRRLVKDTKVANGAEEPPQKIEPFLTSALFIHKDLDKMVESTVFMKPKSTRNYPGSKSSGKINQRSLRINNMRVRYKGKEKDEIIETFKSASEPSWKDKKKIIHRERLDENINYLVKQLVFLGTKNIIDFPMQKKQEGSFNQSSGYISRDLSKEVSPEILVNIKPFKEYLSDNSDSCKKSSRGSRLDEERFGLPKNRPLRASRKAGIQNVSEKCIRPVLKSTVTLVKKNDSAQDQENFLENEVMRRNQNLLTLPPVRNEGSVASWNEDASEDLGFKTQSFSFWDMYKTYSKGKNFVQVEVELGGASFQFKQKKKEENRWTDLEVEEDTLRNTSSLDEVLNTLEDGDHDLIFQRNLSQFKKKISVMPRLDIRKSKFGTSKKGLLQVEDKVWQNLIAVDTENHTKEKVVEIRDLSLGNSMEKKIEICRSKCLPLERELLWKSEKVLENIYLTCCESTVINQILATRVEANLFSLCQPLREVHNMQENNIVVMIKVENPTNFRETSKRIEILSETPALLQNSYQIEPKQSETVTFLYIDLNAKEIVETAATDETDETDENCTHSSEASHRCQSGVITFNFGEELSGIFLEFSKEMNTNEKGMNEANEIEFSLEKKTFQTLTQVEIGDNIRRRVALILNDPFYDYTAHIYEKKIGFLKHRRKYYSEPNVFKKLVSKRRHRSDSGAVYKTTKVASSETQKSMSSNSRSCNFSRFRANDFHVFRYSSNENLKKNQEEIKVSCRHFVGNTKANKKEKQKEMDDCENKVRQRIYNYIPRETKSLEKCLAKKTRRKVETHISNFAQYTEVKACLDEVEEAFVRIKPDFDKSLAIPIKLMLRQEGEADKRITFQLRKTGANLKKELVAAINLIKNLDSSKEEAKGSSKQMSLIMLFSKN